MFKVGVELDSNHSLIDLSGEVPDDQVERLRKDLLSMLRSVFVFGHCFEDEVVLDHFTDILSRDVKLKR